MKIELVGINLRPNPDWAKTFAILGFGDIRLPEIETTMRGCALAWSYSKLIALPPKVPGAHPGDLSAIGWNPSGKFAERVRDAILEGYQKMGGEMPPEPTAKEQKVTNATRRVAEKAVRRDHVTDKPIGPDPFDEPIQRRVVPAIFVVDEDANEQEAVEGLHRTLGVDPGIVDEMRRAGL
ncbi:hypothetical protein [Rhizobium leucaenae]|uniref:hypothetical protein n=1 Tax=Rhizobium leucaenae TaxID=29450 RepID=UPI00160EF966|nr:hypothetical protein [Rhizobium leucaenae]MBB6299412.1 hypothetical protein [Rhizobium leucaenae]